MIQRGFLFLLLVFPVFSNIYSQTRDQGNYPDVIRGEVFIDLEPIYAGHVDEEYPLDIPTAARRALEEAAMLYSAMIYGWSFHYDIGERARGLNEHLELEPVAFILFGDPGLRVTDTEFKDLRLRVWTDYFLTPAQQNRMEIWRTGTIRNAQAVGYAPSYLEEYPGWLAVKKSALDDAARAALRAMLRSSERNRPKEASGFISLASFPRFYIEGGRWAASARFRVQVLEIAPFNVY